MSDTFNFQRFGRYFRFDLARMWRNNTKTAVLLGCGTVLTVLLVGLAGLLLDFHWHTANDPFRFIGFVIALCVLELLMAKTYGFITDRKNGSDFLMIPASTLEKWVSMMLVCLVVIPVLFFATYMLVDGFVCTVLPAAGRPLFSWFGDAIQASSDGFKELNASLAGQQIPLQYSLSSIIVPSIISFWGYSLYFLLCGLLFKRHKILNAILVMMGLSLVFSLVLPHLLPNIAEHLEGMNEKEAMLYADGFLNVTILIGGLIAALLAVVCYVRLRKIAH